MVHIESVRPKAAAISVLGLLLAFETPGQAAGRNHGAEALALIDSLTEGSVSPNHAVNRLTLWGAERLATEQLTQRLRKLIAPGRKEPLLEVLSQLAVFSDEAETVLLRALDDEPLGNRMAAARALGRIKSVRATPKLELLLADPAIGLRKEAARALAAIGQPRSGAALMSAAKNEEDPSTRALYLVAVGRSTDSRQRAALEAFLQNSSESTRMAAAQALCLLGSTKGQAFVSKMLASSDLLERLEGVKLLQGTGLKVAKPLLTPLLADPDHRIRAAAGRVLLEAGDTSSAQRLAAGWASSATERDEKVAQLRARPLPDRVVEVSAGFLGTPYAPSPLGEQAGKDADPLIRYDAVDCLTLVETVMALSLSPDASSRLEWLNRIRYFGEGEPAWVRRNHLMEAQWLPHNLSRGLLRDVTQRYGGRHTRSVTKVLTSKTWRQKAGAELALPEEVQPNGSFSLSIVPADAALAALRAAPSGLVVVVVRADRPAAITRVSHVGFLIQTSQGPVLRHASRSFKQVADEPLERYLHRNLDFAWWTIEGFSLYEIQEPAR